jgi:hypothetical protein
LEYAARWWGFGVLEEEEEEEEEEERETAGCR